MKEITEITALILIAIVMGIAISQTASHLFL